MNIELSVRREVQAEWRGALVQWLREISRTLLYFLEAVEVRVQALLLLAEKDEVGFDVFWALHMVAIMEAEEDWIGR